MTGHVDARSVIRIARNLTINLLQAQRRQVRGSGDTDVALRLAEYPAGESEASALFDVEYRRRLFDWAAARVRGEFSDAAWRAFVMTGVEGRSAREVAETLGTTVGTVYYSREPRDACAARRAAIEDLEGGPEGP